VVLPGASTGVHREAIISAAARGRLPAMYPFRSYRLCRNGWVHLHDERHADDACDWRDVTHEIEID
jgi:hypothetical protein